MKIKKTTLGLIVILMVIALGGYFFFASGTDASSISGGNDEIQKITLGMRNGNYYPNTLTVKANQPVEITLDSSVKGCYRSFTIRSFGVSKYTATPAETITFTPAKAGKYQFACSMGMGYGTLIVE